MTIQDALKSLKRSSDRLQTMSNWDLTEPVQFIIFRRETWIHLKRSFKLWFKTVLRKRR